MGRAHGALAALLAVLLGGCRVGWDWDWPNIDSAMVPLPSDAPCSELVGEARARGLEVIVSDGGGHIYTRVLAADETLLLRGEIERIRGSGVALRKRPVREFQATLVCGMTTHELPARTCRVRGRAYGVIDLRPLQGLEEVGEPEAPCRLNLNLRVGGEWWGSRGHHAIIRRSPRAILEGGR